MATKHWIHTVSHDSSNDFKEWVSSLSEGLEGVGLARSDDTGQIDIESISEVPPV